MSLLKTIVTPARRAVITLIVATALIAVTGCTNTLNMEGARKPVSEGLAKQLELEMAAVTCPPESRPLQAGDSFECTATPKDGGSISVKVTQQDDVGNITWEVAKSEGLFDMNLVEASVQQGLMAQAGAEATVSCGARWRVGKAGDTFECEVEDADGGVSTAVVTVKDAEGNISWSVK